MSTIEVVIPDIGGATDVEVIEVCVNPGDQIAAEDSLIVLESDKASLDVPAPQGGVVKEIKVNLSDKVNEGDLILLLETEGASEPATTTGNLSAPVAEPVQVEAEAGTDASETVPMEAVSTVATSTQTETIIETILVPDLGGAQDVVVIELAVAVGDAVDAEDPIVVLESDKASMEVPAPSAGKITRLLVAVEDNVEEGSPIAEIEVANTDVAVGKKSVAVPADKVAPVAVPVPLSEPEPKPTPETPVQEPQIGHAPLAEGAKVHAGPSVRRIAREFGVDLTMVRGSGPKSRIIKEDVQGFVKSGLQLKSGVAASGSPTVGIPSVSLPDFAQFGKVERSSMTRIHQLTAENMLRSWSTVPHVTQFDKADITGLESFRKRQKVIAEKKGVRLTPLPFLIKTCASALETYPQFNVSLDISKHEVIQKHYVNIGFAVDTPGGLVVPVIRDANKKGLWQLAAECADLAAKAQNRSLRPADMQGGCFTISSLGSLGGTAFTPIINTPEVAILGVSKAQMEPVHDGEGFNPRLMLPLCLSYDHRAINGADAARFTSLLGYLLGDIRNLLL